MKNIMVRTAPDLVKEPHSMTKRRTVRINGCVFISYPRRPWELWRKGWKRHTDGLGRPCWIRFNWESAHMYDQGGDQ